MTALTLLLWIHVAGGTVALLAMIVPMLARKGGTLHRRAGWVFVGGMTTVSLTAFVLAAARFITDASPQGRFRGIFLFFIAILTAAGVSAGVRVLRAKQRRGVHRGAWDHGVAAVLTASSVAMAVYGLATGTTLFIVFSIVGLANGIGQLRYWLRPQSHPMHWWFEHMGQMIGSSVAATTAFLVLNADRLGLSALSLVVWLGPAVIGLPLSAIWQAYYRRRFALSLRSGEASASPSGGPEGQPLRPQDRDHLSHVTG
jgi:uncharacterized membrane protein